MEVDKKTVAEKRHQFISYYASSNKEAVEEFIETVLGDAAASDLVSLKRNYDEEKGWYSAKIVQTRSEPIEPEY